VGYWSDELFTSDLNYQYPERFNQNNLAPFDGMVAGALDGGQDASQVIESAVNYGIGMSVMIKYLMDRQKLKEGGLPSIYEKIQTGSEPASALLNSVNALVADWWPDFFMHYIRGDYYNLLSSVFTNYGSLTGSWDINSDSDVLKVFSATYPDLSAKRYMINLNHSAIGSSANLILEVSGEVTSDGITTLVFVVDNNINLQHLVTAQGSNNAVISNLKDYYDNGLRQFLVVVVNNTHDEYYIGNQDIDLTVKVSSQQSPTFNRCGLMLEAIGHYTANVVLPDTSYTYNFDGGGFQGISSSGSFSGYTFTGSSSETVGTGIITNTITAVLNESLDAIISIDGTKLSSFPWGTETTQFTGTNIPLDYTYGSTMIFLIEGEVVCDHITSWSNVQQAGEGLSYRLNSHECDSDSRIWVSIAEE
jgi:hypothetical protein